MANYSIVINSKFKPFSYQELLAPALQMTQEHQMLEEAYSELDTKASEWERKANEQTDKKAYSMYKKYADDLRNQADILSRQGLTPTARKDLYGMRSRYAREILPIAEAYNKREELAKEQRQALLRDPTLLIRRKANEISLDDFIDNPALSVDDQFSGAMLTQMVGQQVQHLSKELKSSDLEKTKDPYTLQFIARYGLSRNEILSAINNPNDPNSDKVLTAIVDSVLKSSGIESWNDPKLLARAREFANQGLWGAMGTTQVTPTANQGAIMATQHKYHMQQIAAQQAFQERMADKAAARQAAENEKNRKHQLKMLNAKSANSPTEWMYSHDKNGNRTGMSPAYKQYLKDKAEVSGKGGKGSKSSTTNSGMTSQFKDILSYNIRTGETNNFTRSDENFANVLKGRKSISPKQAFDLAGGAMQKYLNSLPKDSKWAKSFKKAWQNPLYNFITESNQKNNFVYTLGDDGETIYMDPKHPEKQTIPYKDIANSISDNIVDSMTDPLSAAMMYFGMQGADSEGLDGLDFSSLAGALSDYGIDE